MVNFNRIVETVMTTQVSIPKLAAFSISMCALVVITAIVTLSQAQAGPQFDAVQPILWFFVTVVTLVVIGALGALILAWRRSR